MNDSNELILQLQIPFCFHKCAYCSKPTCRYETSTLRAYTQSVLREIESLAPDMQDRIVTAVSIEGGCPGLMLPEDLQKMALSILRHFKTSDDLFFSIHMLPGEQSRSMMDRMGAVGINRWTVSIPTMNDKLHYLLHRPYNIDAVSMVDTVIRNFPMRALDFEVMYGIPGQTKHQFLRDLERMMSYRPEHMTLKCFHAGEGTELEQKISSGELHPVSPEETAEFYFAGAQYLREQGMEAYTIQDFALPGHENRYLLKKLSGVDHLGIGYHAISDVDGITYENGHNLQEYLESSHDLSIIANHISAPDSWSRMIREIYSALYSLMDVDPGVMMEKYGLNLNPDPIQSCLLQMVQEKMLSQEGDRFHINPYGIVKMESIAGELDHLSSAR